MSSKNLRKEWVWCCMELLQLELSPTHLWDSLQISSGLTGKQSVSQTMKCCKDAPGNTEVRWTLEQDVDEKHGSAQLMLSPPGEEHCMHCWCWVGSSWVWGGLDIKLTCNLPLERPTCLQERPHLCRLWHKTFTSGW